MPSAKVKPEVSSRTEYFLYMSIVLKISFESNSPLVIVAFVLLITISFINAIYPSARVSHGSIKIISPVFSLRISSVILEKSVLLSVSFSILLPLSTVINFTLS